MLSNNNKLYNNETHKYYHLIKSLKLVFLKHFGTIIKGAFIGIFINIFYIPMKVLDEISKRYNKLEKYHKFFKDNIELYNKKAYVATVMFSTEYEGSCNKYQDLKDEASEDMATLGDLF